MHKAWLTRVRVLSSENPKSKIGNRKWAGLFAIVLALAFGAAVAQAQQPGKIPRIGYLNASSATSAASRVEAFRLGLRELGYVEEKNIVVEYRFADGNLDRLKQLTTELVQLDVDIIVSGGPTATRPAKEATSTIPIVMGFDDDPVGAGFVASLARPGGNITGLSTLAPEISGKEIGIIKEIVPRLSHVAVFGTSTRSGTSLSLQEIELAAAAFKMQIQYLDIQKPKDIETGFGAANKAHADAIVVLGTPMLNLRRTQIVDLAVKNRMPGVYAQPEYIDAGGLMYYGASFPDIFQRAATYVDKILKGARPADLPVEQPKKFEFVINLKAAKQIGLTIPPNVLVRADRVIK
jgi:putative ABC transport system substrate-binding protein